MIKLLLFFLLMSSGAFAAGGPASNIVQFSNGGYPTNVSPTSPLPVTQSGGTVIIGTVPVVVVSPLPAGSNSIGSVTQSGGPWTENLTQVNGSAVVTGHGTAAGAIRVELPTDGTGKVNAAQSGTWTVGITAPINTGGSGTAGTVSTVITLTAPVNAVGAYLMNMDTSTANVRWAVGRVATTSVGQQLQPGRDAFIQTGTNISLVAESGTQNYDVQWITQ